MANPIDVVAVDDLRHLLQARVKPVMADGALPKKTKELIAVAVALTTQCQYCLAIHTDMAKKAGATTEELAEASFVAAALRAGAAITHSANHVVDGK